MGDLSYEFDVCSVDGSDKEVTLDEWKPSVKDNSIQKSEWRKNQNNGDYDQQPGLDELKKINMYLKKDYPDSQIMDTFGISSETLVAIKRGCYDPIEGISLDNQIKIYKEFSRLNQKIGKLNRKIEQFQEVFRFIFEKDEEKRAFFEKIMERLDVSEK